MKNEERIETLTKLGLTVNQARIYLALLQKGSATAKGIAEASKIARPDVYRTIPTLQKEGIVEKIMTKPATFQAIPIKYVLPMMLKSQSEEQKNLKRKTEELLRDVKGNRLDQQIRETDKEFSIVPRKVAIIKKLEEALAQAQLSVCTVTSQKRFSSAIVKFEEGYKRASKRGVKIRLCTEKQPINKKVAKILQRLSLNTNFEVKYFDDPPAAVVSIFDGKEAYVTMSAAAHLAEASALWSNNPCFLALAQNYFECKWEKASSQLAPP